MFAHPLPHPEFWRGKRVFLTGHTGFVGGWMALWLHHLGARVVGYALEPETEPNLYDLTGLGELIERSHIADITDGPALINAMREAAPEIAIHMAAQPLVRRSYRQPVETFASNVMGTVHFMEALRQTPSLGAAVIITSDKCYAPSSEIWGHRETDPMGGHDPYSASKGCAELVVSSWRDSYVDQSAAIASARAGNIIGGGDWSEDRLLPDLIRAAVAGAQLEIRSPNAIRPWQHVLDANRGYLLLAEKLYNDPNGGWDCGWNMGPGPEHAWTVEKVMAEARPHWESPIDVAFSAGPHPHENPRLGLDSTKAQSLLHWRPAFSIPESIEATMAWYRAWATDEEADMRAFSLEQIELYAQHCAPHREDGGEA
ncbi:CDP-glucose 4,6-dehydratase [Magnetofaba australis]|uniref:Putative CDP-glucose 4,6-dehydratase n=1 Tax=Magnetofaba australis IT-1 TaxID=1434232 RepID=A0A1Y2K2K1_9PROT|nr:CDP-glucose 4,6-dehydratase [Magnetofaba australis]OSM02260.1 putative CDP-glucose 4,6-dehydratase [Magnetofaba australis IT-1]